MVAMAGTAAMAARSGRRGVVVDRQCDAVVTIGVCDVVEARMQKVAIQFSFEFVKKVKYLFVMDNGLF